MRHNCIRIAIILVFFGMIGTNAIAQSSNGSVRGTVLDASKAVIPNVTVVLTNTATGITSNAVSNSAGLYVFPAIAPGPYKITAGMAGMSNFDANITVQSQQSVDLDVVLAPAGTQTIVSVQDVTPILKTDTPTLSHSLERARIEQLPINGRNVVGLLNTIPGLQQDNSGTWRTFGTRVGTQDISLDGAALTDAVYGGAGVARMPSLDSIQEVNVVNNASSAKYARQGNIILTTKSGTNEIHGTLFETHRNNAFGVARRRENNTNTAAKLIRNEYGGTVGGPVYIPKLYDGRNKSFFFFAYEGYKQRQGPIGNFRVPTEAMRNGDFSGLTDSAGTRLNIYNPFTADPVTHLRQQFVYQGTPNRIDPALQSPISKYFNSVIPLPNIPGVNPLVADNYSAARPDIYDQSTWTMKFDQRITDKDQVYVRLGLGDSVRNRPAANGVPTLDAVGNSRLDTAPNKSISGNWTRSFSPTFFNELLLSGTRTIVTQFTGDTSRQYATELGLPNPGGAVGFPVINDIGVGTGASNYFQPLNWTMQFFNYFILDNNSTKIHGRHEIQFGAHLRYDQLSYTPQQQRTAGGLSFPVALTAQYDPTVSDRSRGVLNTGAVAASAFLGLANYDVRLPKGRYYMRQNEHALYVQDNFRVNSRLTLNLGLRWQFSPYPKDKYDIFSSFDPKSMSIVLGRDLETLYAFGATSPALINALQKNGAKFVLAKDVPGFPSRLVNNNWHDIGPHVGFAYRAFDDAKSFVIRGGFSTSYFPLPMYGWNDRMRLNSPFTGFYQNMALTSASESPDGLSNYGFMTTPTIIAGRNSANAIDLSNPTGLTIGSEAYQTAYFNPDQPSSRVHDWNLTIEKEIMPDTVLRAGYVGNHASYQDSYDDWNQQIPAYVWYQTTKRPLPTGVLSNQLIRPNSAYPYGNLQEYRKDGWGNSNGVLIEVERRLSKGVGFQVFYTMLNAMKAGGHGWYADSSVAPVTSFLPGAVPQDHQERMKLLLYARDITIPHHEVRWNWIADLPFGKGKPLGRNSNRFLDAVIGGWQVTGLGRWRSNYFTVPEASSNLWPTENKIEYYGHNYPIQDCRSGKCLDGYLLWNGYIPAHQINSVDTNGNPNGIMGVPSNYKPAIQPLYPYPADYRSRSSATDPLYGLYGTSRARIPLDNGQVVETNYAPLHPYRNQYIASTNSWNCDASIFKSFSITERARLRVQADFFNVFNTPGNNPVPADNTGFQSTWQSYQDARTLQLSARFSW
jgi:hypothetical protein